MSKAKIAYSIEVVTPFPEDSWPLVWEWLDRFRSQVCDDFGPQTIDEFVEMRMSHEGPEFSWGIVRNGELGGIITFTPLNPVVGYAHTLFKKEFWGRHTTLPALKQVATAIFDLGYHKIAMTPFETNGAIRSLLEELGAKEEGVLKEHTMRNGELAGIVQYRLTRAEMR